MKKILFFATILLLLLAVPFSASAEDATEIPTADETQTEQADQSLTEFFNDEIRPALISVALALGASAPILVAFVKKIGQYKTVVAAYAAKKAENADLKGLVEDLKATISAVDIVKFKEEITNAFTEAYQKAVDSSRLNNALLAEFAERQNVVDAKVQALLAGATNAWSQSPAAVACLTALPNETVLRKQAEQIHALEAYIRQTKGDEADVIIADLKGVQEDDKQGENVAV